MKINRSMGVMFVLINTFTVLTGGKAFAAGEAEAVVNSTEEFDAGPLALLTVVLAAVVACAIALCVVFYLRYRAQKELICQDDTCAANPKLLGEERSYFDYSQLETPDELPCDRGTQLDVVIEELRLFFEEEPVAASSAASAAVPASSSVPDASAVPDSGPASPSAPDASAASASFAVYAAKHRKALPTDVTAPMPTVGAAPEVSSPRGRGISVLAATPHPTADPVPKTDPVPTTTIATGTTTATASASTLRAIDASELSELQIMYRIKKIVAESLATTPESAQPSPMITCLPSADTSVGPGYLMRKVV